MLKGNKLKKVLMPTPDIGDDGHARAYVAHSDFCRWCCCFFFSHMLKVRFVKRAPKNYLCLLEKTSVPAAVVASFWWCSITQKRRQVVDCLHTPCTFQSKFSHSGKKNWGLFKIWLCVKAASWKYLWTGAKCRPFDQSFYRSKPKINYFSFAVAW